MNVRSPVVSSGCRLENGIAGVSPEGNFRLRTRNREQVLTVEIPVHCAIHVDPRERSVAVTNRTSRCGLMNVTNCSSATPARFRRRADARFLPFSGRGFALWLKLTASCELRLTTCSMVVDARSSCRRARNAVWTFAER
jgi:hypothetical protein